MNGLKDWSGFGSIDVLACNVSGQRRFGEAAGGEAWIPRPGLAVHKLGAVAGVQTIPDRQPARHTCSWDARAT